MTRVAVALLLALAACGGDFGPGGDDGVDTCTVGISFTPTSPLVGNQVRATGFASASVTGVRSYSWTVTHGGALVAFEDARPDESEISFTADEAGVYSVTLDLSVTGYQCNAVTEDLTVRAGDGNDLVRLHVEPPLDAAAPPYDQLIEVPDSPDFDLGVIALDPGTSLAGTVTDGTDGVAAYLRFEPLAAPEAAVEVFTDPSGAFTARLAKVQHSVLIIPAGHAPRRATWNPSASSTFTVGGDVAVSGVVRDPANAPIAGAKVQLVIAGVPSTLATTGADGSYTLDVATSSGSVEVEVVPPASTGLPRLEASGMFDLGEPIDVRYASTLVVRDLAGLQLQRGGNPLAGATLTVVGALSSAGTIGGLSAIGDVRATATADASGALPARLVAAGPLTGVIGASATDLAVVPLDLSSSVPATLTAPAMAAITTTISHGDALGGVSVQLVPQGELALAGAGPIYLTSGANGTVSGAVASGGTYDLLITDPAGRGAPLAIRDVTSSTLAAAYELPEPVHVSGELTLTGNPNRLVGAAVQILCESCDGVDRARPLAEGASDQGGTFTLAVPRPASL